MNSESDTFYIDLGFETLMRTIYGYSGHSCHAGHTRIPELKKSLCQLFRTVKSAIRKNLTGDDRYKEYILDRCDTAIDAIRLSKIKDEILSDALQFLFEIIFLILGRVPNNFQSKRAHHTRITDLGYYRTICYARNSQQKSRQITDAAYHNQLNDGDPSFEILIAKLRREFHDDGDRFLSWLREEHRDLYDRFH